MDTNELMWGEIPEVKAPSLVQPAPADPIRGAVVPAPSPVEAPIADPGTWDLECFLDAVVASPAVIQLQSRDEPDLTPAAQRELARRAWTRDPAACLARFGPYLSPSHLQWVASHQPEVRPIANSIRPNVRRIRNRRWAYVQRQLAEAGEYFQLETMRRREPGLYEGVLGRYLRPDERRADQPSVDRTDLKLSTIILDHIDLDRARDRLRADTDQTEFDSDDDTDDIRVDPEESVPTAAEKELLRDEFRQLVIRRFLDGRDEDFDYRSVDQDGGWDDLAIWERDAQDRYFDSD